MVKLEDVRTFIASLPETSEGVRRNNTAWAVAGKVFAWHRPFSKADIKRFGDQVVPEGDILALSTVDLDDKEAILAAGTKGFFTIEHFNDYPAFLIELNCVSKTDLKAALLDSWLTCAPTELAAKYSA